MMAPNAVLARASTTQSKPTEATEANLSLIASSPKLQYCPTRESPALSLSPAPSPCQTRSTCATSTSPLPPLPLSRPPTKQRKEGRILTYFVSQQRWFSPRSSWFRMARMGDQRTGKTQICQQLQVRPSRYSLSSRGRRRRGGRANDLVYHLYPLPSSCLAIVTTL
jgi:hypothetical protein